MGGGTSLDYGKDVINYKSTNLMDILDLMEKEDYHLFKPNISKKLYEFVPKDGKQNFIIVKHEVSKIEIIYTSFNGKEQSKGLLKRLNKLLNKK